MHLMAGQPQGQQLYPHRLLFDEKGLSSLDLPTGLGGAGGGLAAMAAASIRSCSATL